MPINGSVSEGDANRILPVDGKKYFPPNICEYTLKDPSLSLDNCTDFNPNVCAIGRALEKLILSPELNGCLVQFWAATTFEGRTLVTTQYQPFALGTTELAIDTQRLWEYRMNMCTEYNFYADAESGEEQLGLPGRVFLHKYPESTPDVKYYSKQEYPPLDYARQCFIKGSWALPVFEHSSYTCVGVLEMVAQESFDSSWHDESFIRNMRNIFQEFGLICLDGYPHCMQCRDGNIKGRTTAFKELDMVLRSVCELYCLPLAMAWVPCSACNDLPLVLECVNQKTTDNHYATAEFLKVAKFSHLRKGGLVERALSSPSMLYCPDITQLSIAEYPLVHYARWCELTGLFTIWLQSSYAEKEVYIVDFFLPINSKHGENILTTLSWILGTMEENFKTFKLASGQQLGEISSVEVKWVQAPTSKLLKDRGLMLELDQLVQPSTDAIHGGMNVINEKQNYILQTREATMQLDSPHQPPLDSSNNGHNVVPPEENITSVTSLEEGKRKTKRKNKGTGVKIEVSLDDILECMGMKRKAAAKKLEVSESTFKRACREHCIDRWPPRNIDNIVGRLWPSPVENQGQTSQLNSNLPFQPLPVEIQGQTLQLNSDEQSNQAVPGVAHMKPGVQDANRVIIRAKYGEKTIKFHLSFSSRLVDFQQEVAKRLPLEVGTYYAEYKDEEGVLIFIACDDDLKDCMDTSRSQGNTSIEVQLKLEKPLVNLNPAN